jgi:RNA polymerase primary sigma factor
MEPTIEELSEILDLDPEEIDQAMQSNVIMINDTITDDNGEQGSIFDSILLDDYVDEDVKSDIKVSIRLALQELNPIEQDVIKDMFGFDTEAKDINVIAEKNNITPERVRQIKDKAIIKLRKSNNIQSLVHYLG